MKSIDWYINEVVNRENVSMSYTRAFSFIDDDVILVEYSKDRESIEEIKNRLDELSGNGVNTPRYLDYKYVGDYCYVLQELAKGKVFSEVTRNHDIEYAANIPVEHYSKFISDVISMNGLGLELRPRNYFYDDSKGFTIIDIQGIHSKNYDSRSIVDVNSNFMHIYNGLNVNAPDTEDNELKTKYNMLNAKRIIKILSAFEESMPGFKDFKKWILRNNSTIIGVLDSVGYDYGDLSLTDLEKKFFIDTIMEYVSLDVDALLNGVGSFDRNYQSRMKNVFEGSISFYDDFSYKDFNDCWESLYLDKLKSLYGDDRDNKIIENALIDRIIKKIDPVRIYDYDSIYAYVNEHLDDYLNGNLDFMNIGRPKK